MCSELRRQFPLIQGNTFRCLNRIEIEKGILQGKGREWINVEGEHHRE